MPQLNKSQVETILKNAPVGTDKKAILDGLIMRGYDLEDVDSNAVRQNLQKQQSQSQEKGSMQQLEENIANLPNQLVMNRGQEALGFIENQPKLAEQAGNSPLAKGLSISATAGHLAGTVARGVGDIFGAIISPFIPKSAQEVIGNVAKTINEKVDSIPGMTPEIKKGLEDVFDTATLLGGAKGEPVAKNAISTGTKNVVKTGQEVIDTSVATGKKVVGKVKEGISPTISSEKALGQIAQGTTESVSPLKETLKVVDTTGVKTYAELANRIENKIPELAKKVDTELLKDTNKYTLDNLKTTLKSASGSPVEVNYVKNALDNLQEFYQKTGDVVKAKNTEELLIKAQKEGLTLKEINDISREYGIDFGSKGFSKVTGEPLTSVNAQAFENTRSGLKDVARNGIGGEEAKALDRQLSNLYDSKKLINKQVEAVNKLTNKIEERGWVSQATYNVVKLFNTVTAGGLRGATDALLNRGSGLKTLNALDLEKNLSRNLEIVNRALKEETEAGFQKVLNEEILNINK
jgi:hypothetical protein